MVMLLQQERPRCAATGQAKIDWQYDIEESNSPLLLLTALSNTKYLSPNGAYIRSYTTKKLTTPGVSTVNEILNEFSLAASAVAG